MIQMISSGSNACYALAAFATPAVLLAATETSEQEYDAAKNQPILTDGRFDAPWI